MTIRKEIDFEAIENNCDRFQVVILTEDGFNTCKNNVIKNLQDTSYPEDCAAAITAYATKQLNGKRVSQLDFKEDSDKATIQRIENFINEVKKQLAAPDGK